MSDFNNARWVDKLVGQMFEKTPESANLKKSRLFYMEQKCI